MTKFLLTILISFTTTYLFTQADKKPNDVAPEHSNNPVSYRLFPTQNMWNFIKLNTRNGQMWQVQFSMKSEKRKSLRNKFEFKGFNT